MHPEQWTRPSKTTQQLRRNFWKFFTEIRDKKGAENFVSDHLSRIERESEPMPIRDEFPDEQLLHIKTATPWFADICNYVVTSQFPPEASRTYKKKIRSDAKYYVRDDLYTFGDFAVIKLSADAFLTWRPTLSSNSAIRALDEAITDHLELPEKCWIVAFIGPLFLETLINSSPPAKSLTSGV
ncbi:hypothetical protein CR513_26679, partial [Mucuna pruriens]